MRGGCHRTRFLSESQSTPPDTSVKNNPQELIRVKSVNQIKFPDQKESMVIELQPKVGEGVVPGLWLVATLNINSDVNGDFHQ